MRSDNNSWIWLFIICFPICWLDWDSNVLQYSPAFRYSSSPTQPPSVTTQMLCFLITIFSQTFQQCFYTHFFSLPFLPFWICPYLSTFIALQGQQWPQHSQIQWSIFIFILYDSSAVIDLPDHPPFREYIFSRTSLVAQLVKNPPAMLKN